MTPGSDMKIVRVDADNAHLLHRALDDVFDDDVDPVRLAALLENSQLIVVAIAEESVVGQVQGMIQHHVDAPPQLYVDNLGVAPAHQRSGIARRLMDEMVEWATDLGCQETWIVTDLDNEAANAFYQALGAQRSIIAQYSLIHGSPT